MNNNTKQKFRTSEKEFMLIRMVDVRLAITKENLRKKVSAMKQETSSLNSGLLYSSIYNIKDNVRKKSFCSVFEDTVEDKEATRKVEEISKSCPLKRRSNRSSHQPWLLERPSSTESLTHIRYTHYQLICIYRLFF